MLSAGTRVSLMAVRIAPDARQQFFDNQGNVLAGGKLFTYLAGTSTKQNTFTTSTGGVANANPIVLDSAGRTPNGVWLTEDILYKFVLAPANDTDPPVSPIWTEDNIEGVNDFTSNPLSPWIDHGFGAVTFIGATQFSVAGDATATFDLGRRIKAVVGASTFYGYVSAASFAVGVTTVTVVLDSGALTGSLTDIDVSVLDSDNLSVPWMKANGTTGLTMTGTLTLSGKPSTANMAANKTYVDQAGADVQNGYFTISFNAGAATIALKNYAGNDPSAADPVKFRFTLSTGVVEIREVTAALSVTVPSTATLGTENSAPFRIWVMAILDATNAVVLGVYKAVAASNATRPYFIWQILDKTVTSTAMSVAADAAQTVYTTIAQTTRPWLHAGYWEGSEATAGTWTAGTAYTNPTFQPGDVMALEQEPFNAAATGGTQIPDDDTIPQSGEGVLFMTALTPPGQRNCDVVMVDIEGAFASDTAARVITMAAFDAGGGANAIAAAQDYFATANQPQRIHLATLELYGRLTASLTVRAGPGGAATITFNGTAGGRKMGGVNNSYIRHVVMAA